MCVRICVCAPQGLSDAVLQRMGQWQYTARCVATLSLGCRYMGSRLPWEDEVKVLPAALKQLSVLPAGSIIDLSCEYNTKGFADIADAVSAAAPSLEHVTILSPYYDISGLIRHAHVFPYARVRADWGWYQSQQMKTVRWPWKHLKVRQPFDVEPGITAWKLLQLPDPTHGKGQYEISVWGLDLSDAHKVWDTL